MAALVRALGSHGSNDETAISCAVGLASLAQAARTGGNGGAEALGEALLRAGVVPQLETFWEAGQSAAVRAAVMTLCAALVQLPGLAAALAAKGVDTLKAAAACAAAGPPGEEGEAQWCAAIAGWRRGGGRGGLLRALSYGCPCRVPCACTCACPA